MLQSALVNLDGLSLSRPTPFEFVSTSPNASLNLSSEPQPPRTPPRQPSLLVIGGAGTPQSPGRPARSPSRSPPSRSPVRPPAASSMDVAPKQPSSKPSAPVPVGKKKQDAAPATNAAPAHTASEPRQVIGKPPAAPRRAVAPSIVKERPAPPLAAAPPQSTRLRGGTGQATVAAAEASQKLRRGGGGQPWNGGVGRAPGLFDTDLSRRTLHQEERAMRREQELADAARVRAQKQAQPSLTPGQRELRAIEERLVRTRSHIVRDASGHEDEPYYVACFRRLARLETELTRLMEPRSHTHHGVRMTRLLLTDELQRFAKDLRMDADPDDDLAGAGRAGVFGGGGGGAPASFLLRGSGGASGYAPPHAVAKQLAAAAERDAESRRRRIPPPAATMGEGGEGLRPSLNVSSNAPSRSMSRSASQGQHDTLDAAAAPSTADVTNHPTAAAPYRPAGGDAAVSYDDEHAPLDPRTRESSPKAAGAAGRTLPPPFGGGDGGTSGELSLEGRHLLSLLEAEATARAEDRLLFQQQAKAQRELLAQLVSKLEEQPPTQPPTARSTAAAIEAAANEPPAAAPAPAPMAPAPCVPSAPLEPVASVALSAIGGAAATELAAGLCASRGAAAEEADNMELVRAARLLEQIEREREAMRARWGLGGCNPPGGDDSAPPLVKPAPVVLPGREARGAAPSMPRSAWTAAPNAPPQSAPPPSAPPTVRAHTAASSAVVRTAVSATAASSSAALAAPGGSLLSTTSGARAVTIPAAQRPPVAIPSAHNARFGQRARGLAPDREAAIRQAVIDYEGALARSGAPEPWALVAQLGDELLEEVLTSCAEALYAAADAEVDQLVADECA